MLNGSFSFSKTKRSFSRMSLGQVHERNNKIKGQGGESDFLNLEDESGLIRCETCGPEAEKTVSRFKEEMKGDTPSHTSSKLKHRENNGYFRAYFSKDFDAVFNTIPCNPFEIDFLRYRFSRNCRS